MSPFENIYCRRFLYTRLILQDRTVFFEMQLKLVREEHCENKSSVFSRGILNLKILSVALTFMITNRNVSNNGACPDVSIMFFLSSIRFYDRVLLLLLL